MSSITRDTIESALRGCQDPYLGQDLVSAGAVKDIRIDGDKVALDIQLGFAAGSHAGELEKRIRTALASVEGIGTIDCQVRTRIVSHAVQKGVKPLPGVKNIIAVASGKGGVGKSTTAVNLALALQAEGAQVGILDADIYGPSIPTMLSCKGQPDSPDGKSIEPKRSYQLQCMSIGNLVDEETPMIWRGPMATGALEQLLNDTRWQDLDYLIIDLPPGTGDIQLTLSQRIPVSGAVIVTTPQDISLLDARRALKMFEKVDVPVLGIVENMSTHVCSQCGHEESIFGQGGGELMARQYQVDLLGSLPLDIAIREGVDAGKPTMAMQPDSSASQTYREIARKVGAKLALRARDYTARFPNIVIEKA